jgi:peptide-methionine (S)-S-oxide reductase
LIGLQRIAFGGGCHWCTEAVFQALRGVAQVEQGFVRSTPPHEAYSEAVVVHFDPGQIGLRDLIEIHLRTHSSTSNHVLRGKYRSAVYALNPKQLSTAQAIVGELQAGFDAPLVTRVLRLADFKPSQERFQNYYRKHQGNQFCERYIDPKLQRLRARYARFAAEPS